MTLDAKQTKNQAAELKNHRYTLIDLLGRGGMASVHRAVDTATGRQVALKRLTVSQETSSAKSATALFEREFHTLAQLSHPRIIEVYDYAIDEDGPYYTMELLDGKDLRERSPLPWREACSLLYDVCSSLALIHSRRLIHRDVTPRNIRSTPDGRAKLIDFGSLAPMGPSSVVVGTPSFLAPEVLHLSALDGRTDLFSVGATLYVALTGRVAFPARKLEDLFECWTKTPTLPSRLVSGIPSALDELVFSLLSLEPTMRPQSAFDVMQRLAAIAQLDRVEPDSVSRAYLSTPIMVGRDAALTDIRGEMTRAFRSGGASVLVVAKPGLGRSRLLDASALEAKTLGATVLRASANNAGDERFGAARVLLEQLLAAHPESAARASETEAKLFAPRSDWGEAGAAPTLKLRDLSGAGIGSYEALGSLARFVRAVGRAHPLALLVDDAHAIDEFSLGLLATLANEMGSSRILVEITVDRDTEPSDPAALELFTKRSRHIRLDALTPEQTQELCVSLFGDVPNIGLVSSKIHDVAAGNPRVSMDLAEYLVERGLARYAAGSWTLPSRLDDGDLPASAEDAMRRRIAQLSPRARWLAEVHALASHEAFTRAEYGAVAVGADAKTVDGAISELVSQQIIAMQGATFRLAHSGWRVALTAGLDDEARRDRHRALVVLYEDEPGLAAVGHLLDAGASSEGLDRVIAVLQNARQTSDIYDRGRLNLNRVAATLRKALDLAVELGRPPREINDLRRWVTSMSVSTDDAHYFRTAPAWLSQLVHDAGLDFYAGAHAASDERARVVLAMKKAEERYLATPETERVYRPAEAARMLIHYAVVSIAIGSRNLDVQLLETLPPLVAPFAPISIPAAAILQNTIATCEARGRCQPERARSRWMAFLELLNSVTEEELPFVNVIRLAAISGVVSMEATLGLASAATRLELLDADPLQQVNALYLRKASRLQQGDWTGADELRKRAEGIALGARSRQMFANSVIIELAAHSLADDLMGVKQLIDRITPLASRSTGWAAYLVLAEGHFKRICGDLVSARQAFDACMALAAPDPKDTSRVVSAWVSAVAGQIETLTALGALEEARSLGESAIEECSKRDIGHSSHEISRALALAEAKLGEHAGAAARIEAVIAAQEELGVTGLLLGLSYEARTRIAIGSGDKAAVEKFAKATGEQYRHGNGSPLSARYERLIHEAEKSLSENLSHLSEFDPDLAASGVHSRGSIELTVMRAMHGAESAKERALRALRLLCEGSPYAAAHLYLFRSDGRLALAASIGEETPPDGLFEFAERFIELGDEALDQVTVQIADLLAHSGDVRGEFVAGDRVYRPMLMTSRLDGRVYYSGVLAVVGDAPMFGTPLLDAIGTHLENRGDTKKIVAD